MFKSYYLGGNLKNETKKVFETFEEADTERIAMFIIEELYGIARDKSYEYEDRVYSVDALKAMYSDR